MCRIYKTIIFLLIISAAACASDTTNITVANGEDDDIGLGGTGLLASSGSGLGGTGIVGEITGFGSVFVNGIEIEYNDKTPFTIDGKKAEFQPLSIGDVIEVLTTNANTHTQAQVINLRHEVIGRVESVNSKTSSYIVQGQTIIQKSDKAALPVIGTVVAVSGIRINEHTIMSTRMTSADLTQKLLRTHTELPFKQKAARWSIQMHVANGQANIQRYGNRQIMSTDKKWAELLQNISAIKILELHKSAAGQLKLDKVIDSSKVSRGQISPIYNQRYDTNKIQKPISIQPGMNQFFR